MKNMIFISILLSISFVSIDGTETSSKSSGSNLSVSTISITNISTPNEANKAVREILKKHSGSVYLPTNIASNEAINPVFENWKAIGYSENDTGGVLLKQKNDDNWNNVAKLPSQNQEGYTRVVSWSPDGRLLLTSSENMLRLWNFNPEVANPLTSGTTENKNFILPEHLVGAIAWHPAYKMFAVGDDFGNVNIYALKGDNIQFVQQININADDRRTEAEKKRHKESISRYVEFLQWGPKDDLYAAVFIGSSEEDEQGNAYTEFERGKLYHIQLDSEFLKKFFS